MKCVVDNARIMHCQRQFISGILAGLVLSCYLSSSSAAPLLAGSGGTYFTQIVFDVELNNTSPVDVTNVDALKGTFGQVDYQSPWRTWQEATISRVYMTKYCNVTNVQWHLDFRVEYSAVTTWTLDSSWKANLQQWYPGAKISTTTATQTGTTTTVTNSTTNTTSAGPTSTTSGTGYYSGSTTINTTTYVLEFSASYLGFGNQTEASNAYKNSAATANITNYLKTVANATGTPKISVVPAVEFAVSCVQLPNANTWFNQGSFLMYLNGLSKLPLNGGSVPAQVLAISLSPDAADAAVTSTTSTAIFSQFAANLTANTSKITKCTASAGCQDGCASMGVCLPQGKLAAQDLTCAQFKNPFECEALGGGLCIGLSGDMSDVALSNWYTNVQYKWPFQDAYDSVNRFLGPYGTYSMFMNISTSYYSWQLRTNPDAPTPPGFQCVPRPVSSCVYNNNQYGCANSGCQWTQLCLPDPCAGNPDPCCGAKGYLCEQTQLPPEVSGRCVMNYTTIAQPLNNTNGTWASPPSGVCQLQRIDCSNPQMLGTEDRAKCRVVEAISKLDGTNDPCVVGGVCTSSTDTDKLCSACKELSGSMKSMEDRLQAEAASCQLASVSTVAPAPSATAAKRRRLFQAPPLPSADTITNMTADMQLQIAGAVLGSLIYAQEMCGDLVARMGPNIGLAGTNATAVCVASGYNSSYNGYGPSPDMSMDDCAQGISMYAAIVKAGVMNGFSSTTLSDFCLSMMLEGLDAMKDKLLPSFESSSECSRLPEDQCGSNPGCFVSESCEVDDDTEATFCSFFNSNMTACEAQPACMYVSSTDPTDCEVLELVVKSYGRAILTNGTAWCTTVGDCDSGCGANCTDCQKCLDFHKTTLSKFASSSSDTEAASAVKTACQALVPTQPALTTGRRMQQVAQGACAAKNATRCYLASSKESCPWQTCSYRTACSSPSASTCDHASGNTLASCEAHAICEVAIEALAAGQPVAGTICKDLCTSPTDPSCTQCQNQVADLVTKLAPAPRYSCFGMITTPTQYQICFPAVSAVVAAGQKCQGVGDLLPALTNSTAKFCTDAGIYNSWCLELFGPTALAMMASGFYPQSPAGLEAFCNRAAPLDTAEAFLSEFGKYACNADDDICCPDWGAMYSKDKCSTSTNGACQPDGECSVAVDACYEAYKQSAATGIPACPAACDKMPFSSYSSMYQPINDAGVDTICFNSTLWDACLAADNDITCSSILDARNQPLCSFQPSCSVPATADYGCSADADPCCVSSPSKLFTLAQQVDCQAQSFAGTQCSAKNQCMQVVDPCSLLRTPWDCEAQDECLFLPTGDISSAFGGICVSMQDPCPSLSGSACEQQKVILGDTFVSRCQLIDRCKSNFCDAQDACCAFSNDYLQCYGTTGCTPDIKCLPEFDGCKDLSATACSTNSYCSYNATSKHCQMVIAKHPCSNITDPYDCSTSPAQCMAVPLCVNGCTVCEQCLKSAYNNVVLPATLVNLATSPEKAADIFYQWCSQNDRYADYCDSIADIILEYPTSALRAGYICSAVDACDSSANCNLQSTKTSATKSALQLCSSDGTTGSPSKTQLTTSAGQCSADSDCLSGQTCEIGASATTQCVCEDGYDVCYTFGTCTAICDTELYKSVLADLKAYYQTCTMGGTTCPTGTICQSSSECVSWSCDPTTGNFVSANCASGTGLCVVSQPKMSTAIFSDNKDAVTVTLDSYAATASFPCFSIFDAATTAKLGALAQCSVSGKQLTISLRGDATLALVNNLTLATSQTLLVDSVSRTAFNGSVSSVSKCAACSKPVAVVTAPAKVVKPCSSSDAATIVFDGTRARDSSGRPFASVAWALTGGSSAKITSAFTAANALAASKVSSAMYVVVAADDLIESTYTYTFTVTNFLGDTAVYTGSFTVVASGTVPMVRVLGGLSQSFSISKGIFLFADVDSKTVCASSTVSVNWKCTTSTTAAGSAACSLTPAAGVSTLNLAIPSVKAVQDQVFTFTLTAAIVGKEDLASTTTVTLKAIASPLQPVIDGPTGDVAFGSNVTFDSSNSQDPDDVTSSGAPTWDCYVRGNPLQKCPSAALVRLAKSLQVNTASLVLNTQYVVALTMKKDVRLATATVAITPRPGDTPTGRAKRQCGWDRATNAPRVCPSKHNRGDNLVVMLELDQQFKAASVVWSLDPTTMPGQLNSSTANGINTTTLVVLSSALPTGTIDLIANISYNGAFGSARLSVPINTPPKCTDATTCFSATPASSALGSPVQGSTFGWDGTYNFEFGVLVRGVYTPSAVANPSTAYSYTGLPVGSSTLYVCAVDDFGARTCQTQSITVTEPTVTGEQLILNELPKYTLDALTSAKNPSVLMSSVCQLGALLKFVRGHSSVVSDATMTLVQTRIEDLITEMGKSDWFPGKSDTAASSQMVAAMNCLAPVAFKPLSAAVNTILVNSAMACIPANKPITTAQSNSVCSAVSSTKSSGGSAGTSPKRKLLQTTTTTTTTTPSQYKTITSAIKQARDAYCSNAQPGVGFLSSGSDSIYFSCAIETAANLNGLKTGLGDTGARRRLLQTNNASSAITYTLPSNYNSWCTANPTACGTTTSIALTYYAAPATWYTTAITNYASMPVADPTATDVRLASGVLEINVGGRADICNATTACTLSADLPISGYNSSRQYACVLLTPAGSGTFLAVSTNITTSSATTTQVTCSTSKTGSVIVASYVIPPLPSPKPVPSPSPKPQAGLNETNTTTTASPSPKPSPSPSPSVSIQDTTKVNLLTMNFSDSKTAPAGPSVVMSLRFSFSYDSIKNQTAKADFLRTVRVGIAYNMGRKGVKEFKDASGNPDISRVQIIGEPRPGSIIVDTKIVLPSSWNSTTVDSFTATVQSQPNLLFQGTILEGSLLSVKVVDSKSSKGVSGGAIAGIVIGVVVGVAIIGGLIYVFVIRKRGQTVQPGAGR